MVFFASWNGERSLNLAIGDEAGPSRTFLLANLTEIVTDFPHAATGPDGSLAVPWSDSEGLRIAIIPAGLLV